LCYISEKYLNEIASTIEENQYYIFDILRIIYASLNPIIVMTLKPIWSLAINAADIVEFYAMKINRLQKH
jgi:hypothetical protein